MWKSMIADKKELCSGFSLLGRMGESPQTTCQKFDHFCPPLPPTSTPNQKFYIWVQFPNIVLGI